MGAEDADDSRGFFDFAPQSSVLGNTRTWPVTHFETQQEEFKASLTSS
jgi:hypothetical protein